MEAINIKGKEYVTVNERIKYFCSHFQKWRIETSFPMLTESECLCEAKIFDENNNQVRNGHAHEYRKGMINSTSMIENAETSAVGRALGMLGIGIDTSVASADEVRMAIEQQELAEKTGQLKEKQEPTKNKLTAKQFNEELPTYQLWVNKGKQPADIIKYVETTYMLTGQQKNQILKLQKNEEAA